MSISPALNIKKEEMRSQFLRTRLQLEREKYGSGARKSWRNIFRLGFLANMGVRFAGLRKLGRKNAVDVQVQNLSLAFPDLPPAFDGFRLLHMTDLHIDGLPELVDILPQKLKDIQADMCLITGDFCYGMPGTGDKAMPLMKALLEKLKYRQPIFATLGNHDSASDVAPLERLGIQCLMNESVPIYREGQRLWICGVDDPHGLDTHDLGDALKNVPTSEFKVLLAHAPEIAIEAAKRNIRLCLSGHTHGGQICLPGSHPILSKSRCPRSFVSGLWTHDGLVGYTSPGVGVSSVAARFFCPPEVTLIELRRLHTNSL